MSDQAEPAQPPVPNGASESRQNVESRNGSEAAVTLREPLILSKGMDFPEEPLRPQVAGELVISAGAGAGGICYFVRLGKAV